VADELGPRWLPDIRNTIRTGQKIIASTHKFLTKVSRFHSSFASNRHYWKHIKRYFGFLFSRKETVANPPADKINLAKFLRRDLVRLNSALFKSLLFVIHKPVILVVLFQILLGALLYWFIFGIPSEQAVNEPVSQSVQSILVPATGLQASQFPFHVSPFYFPFKTRATVMNKLEPFSQIPQGKNNSHGFRTPEYTIAHPPDIYRIVVIGDDVTYGSGVATEQTFPFLLQNLLNQKCAKTKFEVIALGGLGDRLADHLIKLLAHGQSLNPDLIIFQLSFNDLEFYNYINGFAIQGGTDFLQFANRRFPDVMRKQSLDRRVAAECLEQIRQWSASHSVPVAFTIFPSIDSDPNGRNYNHYNPQDPRAGFYLASFTDIIQELESAGFAVLDLQNPFRRQAQDQYLAVAINDPSPNSFAHKIAATALSDFLSRNNLVSCPARQIREQGEHWSAEYSLRKLAIIDWQKMNTEYGRQADFFSDLQKLYPKDVWIAAIRADVHYGMQEWDQAYDTYRRLVELAPQITAPWYQMALCTRYPHEKIQLLERTVLTIPDHNHALEEVALNYFKQQRVEDSCTLLSRLIEFPSYKEQYDRAVKLYEIHRCKNAGPRRELKISQLRSLKLDQ
jgi:tetratricopeptide (TPR) repeat protein